MKPFASSFPSRVIKTTSFAVLLGLAVISGGLLGQDTPQSPPSTEDIWEPFRPLVGTWTGDRSGMGGDARQSVEWKFVLGDQFLQYKTKTIKGDDPHSDLGLISYDKTRERFVCRAFFSEGFVNHYLVTISDDGQTFTFESESVENGPPGFRIREVMKLSDAGQLHQECFMGSGDSPLQSCIVVKLKKDE